MLSESKRCLGCNKVVAKEDLVRSFRRTRWTVGSNKSGIETTVPFMFSKYCLECESTTNKPGKQIKQGNHTLYSRV